MAKVKDPLHSVEARGKVAGLIYNTGRGGKYVKGFTSPVQPRTPLQLARRALLLTVGRTWATILAAERAAWGAYASAHPVLDWTGNTMLLSGFNWYVRCNFNLSWLGFAMISDPPPTVAPDSPVALVGTGGAGQISMAWTPYGGTDKTIIFWLQGPMSVGRVAKIEMAKYADHAAAQTSPLVITLLSPGYYSIFAHTMDEDTGLTSAWALATATVT